jgi:hypothetical protein
MTGWRRGLARGLRAAASVAEGRRSLTVPMQSQLQSNWCWAACTCSTSAFYDPGSTWGQCALVNAELGQTTCCADGASADCDVPWYLDRVLQRTGNFRALVAGRETWDTVRREIGAGHPVGARIAWRGGGAHFVLLTGYWTSSGQEEIEVQDPLTGLSTMALDVFAGNYKGAGTWTHTYLTTA